MRVEDRTSAEEADARDDLGRDACRVTVRMTGGVEADLRDADRQMGEQRGADTDEYVRTKAGGLPGDLTLEADRAAEQRREQELEQQGQSQCFANRAHAILGEKGG